MNPCTTPNSSNLSIFSNIMEIGDFENYLGQENEGLRNPYESENEDNENSFESEDVKNMCFASGKNKENGNLFENNDDVNFVFEGEKNKEPGNNFYSDNENNDFLYSFKDENEESVNIIGEKIDDFILEKINSEKKAFLHYPHRGKFNPNNVPCYSNVNIDIIKEHDKNADNQMNPKNIAESHKKEEDIKYISCKSKNRNSQMQTYNQEKNCSEKNCSDNIDTKNSSVNLNNFSTGQQAKERKNIFKIYFEFPWKRPLRLKDLIQILKKKKLLKRMPKNNIKIPVKQTIYKMKQYLKYYLQIALIYFADFYSYSTLFNLLKEKDSKKLEEIEEKLNKIGKLEYYFNNFKTEIESLFREVLSRKEINFSGYLPENELKKNESCYEVITTKIKEKLKFSTKIEQIIPSKNPTPGKDIFAVSISKNDATSSEIYQCTKKDREISKENIIASKYSDSISIRNNQFPKKYINIAKKIQNKLLVSKTKEEQAAIFKELRKQIIQENFCNYIKTELRDKSKSLKIAEKLRSIPWKHNFHSLMEIFLVDFDLKMNKKQTSI